MKRNYFFSKHTMFRGGIEELLRQNASMALLGRENDIDRAVKQIAELHPDVVIIGYTNDDCDIQSAIQQILQLDACIRIIGLDLSSSMISILQQEHRHAAGMDDLLHAIENNFIDQET